MRRLILGCVSLTWLLSATAQVADPGRLYGTVVLREGGELSGALRWDGEELLWIHHFNGNKAAPFDLDQLAPADRDRILDNQPGPQLQFDGHTVELAKWLGGSDLRAQFFGIEFGAISELRPGRGERVKLTLRDGSPIEADGGSNDIDESDIEVLASGGLRRSIDWDDVEVIRFQAPPGQPEQFPPHLFGRVQTAAGDFEGFVEWDHDERRADERLDGEVDGIEEEIEFGSIRAIAKESDGSRVTLSDGQSKFLTGTNDVNSDNRGIVVTGPAFGQVDIPWSAFRAVTFSAAPESLPGYAEFAGIGPLSGAVTTIEGRQLTGKLVFDLDQFHRAEIIEGRSEGILYRIPLRLVSALEPLDERRSRVRLRSGEALVLGANNDVTSDNNGIAVLADGAKPAYLPWSELRRIDFD